MSSKQGFILIEILMALLLLVVLWPIVHGAIFHELRSETLGLARDEEARQVQFVQMTLERLNVEASSVAVLPDRMSFTSSRDVTSIYLRNSQLAQDNGVIRYLLTAPIKVTGLQFTAQSSKRVLIDLKTPGHDYQWSLVR